MDEAIRKAYLQDYVRWCIERRRQSIDGPRLTSIALNWHEGYGNRPTIDIRIEGVPTFIYQRVPPMYFAIHGDVASFYAYRAPGTGYGGATIEIDTPVGPVVLKGPWSGRSSICNQLKLEPTIDAHVPGVRVSAVLLAAVVPFAIEQDIPIFEVIDSDGEINYEPGRDGRRKETSRGDQVRRIC